MTHHYNTDDLVWAVVINGSRTGVVYCDAPVGCLCRHFPTEPGVDAATYFASFDEAHDLMTSLISYGVFHLDAVHTDCDELAESIDWWTQIIDIMHVDDLVDAYGGDAIPEDGQS